MWKRTFDLLIASIALVLASPLLLVLTALIRIKDGRPVLFRQLRVGRLGRPFVLYKLRSMRNESSVCLVTAADDERITTTGRFLRQYKLDELPQFWNVWRGDMSLIGPRPEVPQYVDAGADIWRTVLEARPGLTDAATLLYRDEERLLAGRTDPVAHYRNVVQPAKLLLNLEYLKVRTVLSDVKLLCLTAFCCLMPGCVDEQFIRRQVLAAARTK